MALKGADEDSSICYRHRMNSGSFLPPAGPSNRQLVVLVVDDLPVLRLTSSLLVEAIGARPVTAENGYEAVALVLEHRYDLILMDLHMPVMDGVAAVRLIRLFEAATPARQRTPIVAYTNLGASLAPSAMLAAGFDAVLCKPADSDVMAACVQLLCPGPSPHDVNADPCEAALVAIRSATGIREVTETFLTLQDRRLSPAEQMRVIDAINDAHDRLLSAQESVMARSQALLTASRLALQKSAASLQNTARREHRNSFESRQQQ